MALTNKVIKPPVALGQPVNLVTGERPAGTMKGSFQLADNFDQPLADTM